MVPEVGNVCVSMLKMVNIGNFVWTVHSEFYITMYRIKVAYELWQWVGWYSDNAVDSY